MINNLKNLLRVLIFFVSTNANAQLKPAVADSFLNFIKANKERSSVYITRNDTIISYLNENKLMPLASTFKILVAIEFAKQVGSYLIDKNMYVPLSELDKYYLPKTDGDAHPNWLAYERKNDHIRNDSVRLIDVARGMIMYSSNANTEFLLDVLGVNNVRSNVSLFGLKNHTAIFAPPASLLMYQNPKDIDEDKILKAISKIKDEEYARHVYSLHVQLKHNPEFKSSFRPQDLTPEMQKVWSDRLPASTTKDYARLANLLNNRKYLSEEAYKVISEVMEYLMEYQSFQNAFKHYGAKGGNTAFVLTHVTYLKTKLNDRMELAIFFNHLTPKEEAMLSRQMDPFEAQVIFDESFRKKLNF
jgi:D-alanyl-D-alanine carboxypeptidase